MTSALTRAAIWLPRVLGALYVGFLGLFALDAFTESSTLAGAAGAFAMHLIPAVLMLIPLLVAWRWPAAGAALYVAAGAYYSLRMARHLSWMLVIAGPVFLLAVLFLLSRRATARRAVR